MVADCLCKRANSVTRTPWVVVVRFAIPMTQITDVNSKFAREAWIRALSRSASIDQSGVILPVLIDRLAHQFEAAPALVSSEASLSYRELSIRCNQYARWGLA